MPARFGDRRRARRWRASTTCSPSPRFALLGWMMGLGLFYWVGLAGGGRRCSSTSTRSCRPSDLSRLDVAFFNVNGYIAVILLRRGAGRATHVTDDARTAREGPLRERDVLAHRRPLRPDERADDASACTTPGAAVAARQTIAAPAGPALDLATGTGDLALALRRGAPAPRRGRRRLLARHARARRGAKLDGARRARRVRLLAADALALPFADRTFACVTSRVPAAQPGRPRAGPARDAAGDAAGRPRGRARDHPAAALPGWHHALRLYFHRVVPRIGALVGGDREAYTYLPQSVDRFVTPHELVALMEQGRATGRDLPTTRPGHRHDPHRDRVGASPTTRGWSTPPTRDARRGSAGCARPSGRA